MAVFKKDGYKKSLNLPPYKPQGNRKKRKSLVTAFTLLELLLALAIAAFILVSSYSALRIGWLSYGRLDNQSQVYVNLRNGLNRIGRDIQNSFLFEYRRDKNKHVIGLEGSKGAMSFITLIRAKDEKGNSYSEVAKVSYKFENKQLLMACIKGSDILKSGIEPAYELFLANISGLEFSYAPAKSSDSESLVWKNEFSVKDEKGDTAVLPAAVRVKVTQEFKGLSAVTLTKSICLSL